MSGYPTHYADQEAGRIAPMSSEEKSQVEYGFESGHVVQRDAVFGDVVEGGPNYRNVRKTVSQTRIITNSM